MSENEIQLDIRMSLRKLSLNQIIKANDRFNLVLNAGLFITNIGIVI